MLVPNVMLAVGLVLMLAALSWAQERAPGAAPEPQSEVTVRWYGQAFFSLTRSDGFTVAIDPFKEMGYPMPKGLRADVALLTHTHFDHANLGIIQGSPTVLKAEEAVGSHTVQGVTFAGTASFHDERQGAQRGKNTAFSFELAGVRFCHMGDIGHLLSDEQRASTGPVDVLMVPVGGHYTIDVEKVDALIAQLNPKVVIPMHFKTEAAPNLPIAPVSTWLEGKTSVKRLGSPSVTIGAADLPDSQEIWVLDYK